MASSINSSAASFLRRFGGPHLDQARKAALVRAHQIEHHLRDIFGPQLPVVRGIRVPHEVGVHGTRADVAHADAVLPHFLEQHFAERVDAGLRRAVARAAGHHVLAGEAADVDDVRLAAPAHMRDRGVAAVEDAGEVGVDHAPPVLVRLGLHRAEPADAGVVDEDVEPAEAPDRFFHHRFNRQMVANVGGKRQQLGAAGRLWRERRLRVAKMIGVRAGDDHAAAFAQQPRPRWPARCPASRP